MSVGPPAAEAMIELAWIDGDQPVWCKVSLPMPAMPASLMDPSAPALLPILPPDESQAAAASQCDWPTLAQVLASAAVRQCLPATLLAGDYGVSVFGVRRRLDDLVRPGERIEVVPPLRVDPKEARRARVDDRRQRLRRDRWHTPRD